LQQHKKRKKEVEPYLAPLFIFVIKASLHTWYESNRTIDVNYVLGRLSTLHIESGDGTEITKLSKEPGFTPQGLGKQISTWTRNIKEFHNLK